MLLVALLIIYLENKRERDWVTQYLKMKKGREKEVMTEAIKKFIGKECIIYLLNGQVVGVIEEVSERSILVKTSTDSEVINLDFVMRVREYPRNKKGKKKTIVC